MHQFWLSCVEYFKKDLSQHQFTTWIKPLSFVQDGDTFTLLAPNRFVLQWAKDRILARIEQAVEKYFARPCSIELALIEGQASSEPSLNESDELSFKRITQTNPAGARANSSESTGALENTPTSGGVWTSSTNEKSSAGSIDASMRGAWA